MKTSSAGLNLKIAVDARRRLTARPRTRRRGESRVARDCVVSCVSSSEGLGYSPWSRLGRHPFARPSREPPRPTQTFGFRRADGHESGLRRTRTTLPSHCAALNRPRKERSCPCAHHRSPFPESRPFCSWVANEVSKGGQGFSCRPAGPVRVAAACRGPKAERMRRRLTKVGGTGMRKENRKASNPTFRSKRRCALSGGGTPLGKPAAFRGRAGRRKDGSSPAW